MLLNRPVRRLVRAVSPWAVLGVVLPVFTSGMASAAPPITSGLVAGYEFNDNADDVSDNGNHGAVIGATPTTDRFEQANSAYYFDGVDDHILVSDHEQLRNTRFSVSAWIQNDRSGPTPASNTIVIKGRAGVDTPGNNATYWLFLDEDIQPKIEFEETNGADHAAIGIPADNEWHHLAGSYNGTQLALYVDGELVDSHSTSADPETNLYPLVIGRNLNWPGDIFEGKIDDVYIYNRALTASEVFTLANIPEPNTALLLGVGLVGMGMRRRANARRFFH